MLQKQQEFLQEQQKLQERHRLEKERMEKERLEQLKNKTKNEESKCQDGETHRVILVILYVHIIFVLSLLCLQFHNEKNLVFCRVHLQQLI